MLAREHRDHSIVFHDLIDHLEDSAPRHRRRQYGALVLNLAVHLSAETLLVHPLVVEASATGEATRSAREREIDALRDRLTDAGRVVDDPEALRHALHAASGEVAAHADREELEVFAHARYATTPKQLRGLGRLHTTLRQRLPSRYQREGRAPTEPWSDQRLHTLIRSWYAESLPDEAPGSTPAPVARQLGERADHEGVEDPGPAEVTRDTRASG